LKRFDCRKKIEKELDKLGLLKDKKDHKMRLGTCQRSKDVVEPMIKSQWYVDCSKISEPMIQAVKTK
jgi:valyl-tRNA synthetase